jgi:penicillin-binding protein 1A
MFRRWWIYPLFALGTILVATLLLVAYAAVIVYPTLPSLEALTEYNPKIPLRIFSADGALIGEFGEERRALIRIAQVPTALKQAIVAAEDERFYEHGGVDYIGVLRAAVHNFSSGGNKQGASTITMQVARNFFLTKEKTFTRKFNEALLAFKIEHSLSKDQILEIYINQIYLGQRAYGFASAAQVYFGKNLRDLNLGDIAMLAGLPKAPSKYNPVVNMQRAKERQLYVLRRMRELNFIKQAEYEEATRKPVLVRRDQPEYSTHADYFAEMVRQGMYERYQDDIYTRGFRVYTTLSKADQDAAYAAVRKGVMDYDKRHGYRGAEGYFDLPQNVSEDQLEEALQEQSENDDIYPALVLDVNAKGVKVFRKGGTTLELSGDAIKFARLMIGDKAPSNRRLRRGALIRIQPDDKEGWQIVQLPQLESALVAMDPNDGAVKALIGGFDFMRNKFNHASQAYRQPGSSFKPFIYSAALEKGFTPATIINDAPLVVDASETGSVPWEPKNFDATFDGPIRMRTALTKSKNLVSIRILQAITPQYAQDYITRFGFDPKQHPPYLTMALGAGSVTPMEMAAGYSVFANGGYKVSPYFITRVEDSAGHVLAKATPVRAGEGAQRTLDSRNAFVMSSMMQDVIRGGTASRAMSLGRNDLAGKTGTTNEQMDAWFAGFQRNLTCVVWMGFDLPRSLGPNETGAVAALPVWIAYMGSALRNIPEESIPVPEGVVAARINPDTGLRTASTAPKSTIIEYFYHENMPAEEEAVATEPGAPSQARRPEDIRNEIY